MRKFRTKIELTILIGVLFYIFAWNTVKEKYNDAKIHIEQLTNTKNDTTVIKDTIIQQKIIEKQSTPIYTDSIPFEYKNNRIIITLYVNDIPVKGILDTGADSGLFLSVVEYEYFKRNGINVGNVKEGEAKGIAEETVKTYNGTLNNIRIGSKKIDTIDVSYSENINNKENLFGINIFNEKFTVDYNTNKIYFHK